MKARCPHKAVSFYEQSFQAFRYMRLYWQHTSMRVCAIPSTTYSGNPDMLWESVRRSASVYVRARAYAIYQCNVHVTCHVQRERRALFCLRFLLRASRR